MIHFRKPYSRWKEGVVSDAIVSYGKTPWAYGNEYDEVRKILFIDLWLIMLKFTWIKKAPPTRPEKMYGQIGRKGL